MVIMVFTPVLQRVFSFARTCYDDGILSLGMMHSGLSILDDTRCLISPVPESIEAETISAPNNDITLNVSCKKIQNIFKN